MKYHWSSRLFAVVSALALALPAFACDNCGQQQVSMPLQIIIKAKVNSSGQEESAQAILMEHSAVQVDNDTGALYAIQSIPANAVVINLGTEEMDRSTLPASVKSMFENVCPEDNNYAPASRWGSYNRWGSYGGLYGYGYRPTFGYSISTPWFNASYGFYNNNYYYPYYYRYQYANPYYYNGYNYYYYYPYYYH